jgi:hypothetical protein
MLYTDFTKKDEVGVACGLFVEQPNAYWVCMGYQKEADSLENLGMCKRITFKQILRQYDGMAYIACILLRRKSVWSF